MHMHAIVYFMTLILNGLCYYHVIYMFIWLYFSEQIFLITSLFMSQKLIAVSNEKASCCVFIT